MEYRESPARDDVVSSAVMTGMPCLPKERVVAKALRWFASNTSTRFIVIIV